MTRIIDAPSVQRQSFRCIGCGVRFRKDTPVMVPVEEFVRAIRAIRCPACGAGPTRIGFGEARRLSEDLEERIAGTEGERAAHWLAKGELGLSSQAIHAAMTGRRPDPQGPAAPADLDDVRRCILLLGHVPEWRGRLGEMGAGSAEWARLAEAWAGIEAAYLAEAPDLAGPAPRATGLLAAALAGGKAD